MRERIEGELDPRERERRKKAAAPPDPELVLMEVWDFVELARSGAYIAGDRRMSRTERTRWRVTFKRLATEAQSALHATDSGPAEEAMELIMDLACHADGCFRWDDPPEAAKFVLSQAVSALWDTVLDVRVSAPRSRTNQGGTGVKVAEPDMNLELAIRVRTAGEVSRELRGQFEAVAVSQPASGRASEATAGPPAVSPGPSL